MPHQSANTVAFIGHPTVNSTYDFGLRPCVSIGHTQKGPVDVDMPELALFPRLSTWKSSICEFDERVLCVEVKGSDGLSVTQWIECFLELFILICYYIYWNRCVIDFGKVECQFSCKIFLFKYFYFIWRRLFKDILFEDAVLRILFLFFW